jgi:large subunit ribosomal protein L24
MALKRLKKNDTVMIIAGRERGKTGKVLRVLPESGRVLVERLNLVKRHTKPRGQQQGGGIISKEAAVDLSNIAVADPKDGKPTRVGFKFVGEGRERKKIRFAKRSGVVING